MPTSKPCRDCGSTTRPTKYPAGRCYSCHRAVLAARRATARDKRILDTYGITASEYDAILEAQGGVCYICQKPFVRKRGSVDHCHKTEREQGTRASIRGVIHGHENTMIGRGRDDPEYFERIAEYLRNPPARGVLGD
jgi:hypothetical protein